MSASSSTVLAPQNGQITGGAGLPLDRPWVIKAGFDPTSPDLHLGHAVLLRALRGWQNQGHGVILIVGDFTAGIGDPSGRNSMRPVLEKEQIAKNAATYTEQAFKILDPQQTTVRYNSEWLADLSAQDLIGLMGRHTVAQMLTRSDFSQRLQDNTPLGLHEIVYPVLQGYDSVIVRADLEVGGTDQLFNLMMGRMMQEQYGQSPQAVAQFPLLVGLDGTRKMSKSLGNHVGLTDDPITMFGKIMSIPDLCVQDWSDMLGVELTVAPEAEPYAAKRQLAQGVVAWLHGLEASQRADSDWTQRFSKREIPDDVQDVEIVGSMVVARVLVELGFASSIAEARRKTQEGAVRIDGVKVSDPQGIVPNGSVIQLGRRRMAKVMMGFHQHDRPEFARPK